MPTLAVEEVTTTALEEDVTIAHRGTPTTTTAAPTTVSSTASSTTTTTTTPTTTEAEQKGGEEAAEYEYEYYYEYYDEDGEAEGKGGKGSSDGLKVEDNLIRLVGQYSNQICLWTGSGFSSVVIDLLFDFQTRPNYQKIPKIVADYY